MLSRKCIWLGFLLTLLMIIWLIPAGFAQTPDEFAYVPNAFEASVSKVNLTTAQEVARYSTVPDRTVGVLSEYRVSRLAVDSLGNAWALNTMTGVSNATGQGSVVRINGSAIPGETTSTSGGLGGIVANDSRVSYFDIGAPGDAPRTINIVESGGNIYLWIGFYEGKYFQKYLYNTSTTPATLDTVGDPISVGSYTPYSADIDASGIMWVSSRNANPYGATGTPGVFKFDTNSLSITPCTYDVSGQDNPYYVLAKSDGTVWVSDGGDWSTTKVRQFAVYSSGLTTPTYVSTGSITCQAMRGFTEVVNDIWATSIDGKVIKFTKTDGTYTPSLILSGLGELAGIGMGVDGNFWVVQHGLDRMLRFDPANPTVDQVTVPVGDGPYAYGDFVVPPETYELCGFKYKNELGGTPLEEWKIFLDVWNGEEFVPYSENPFEFTNKDGKYCFTNLPKGTYRIRELTKANWEQLLPQDPDSYEVTLPKTDQDPEFFNFVNRKLYELEARKYNDVNLNGNWDEGDLFVSGIEFELFAADKTTSLGKATSDSKSGEFFFKNLPAGTYYLKELSDHVITGIHRTSAGGAKLELTAEGLIPVEIKDSTVNNGFQYRLRIYNAILFDICGFKYLEDTNQGLSGWTIELRDAAGKLIASTTTDETGKYCFKGLREGTYEVTEVLKDSWHQVFPEGGKHTITVPGDLKNLIVNGDFESGNTGFFSEYKYVMLASTSGGSYGLGSLDPEGTYAVGLDPSFYHQLWASYKDHTEDDLNNLMMIVNGSDDSTYPIVWSQTIDVVKNSEYTFSFWAASSYPTALADIDVYINGVKIGNIKDPGVASWTKFSALWSSGDATQAVIKLVCTTNEHTGNDFALDDFSLVKAFNFRNEEFVKVTAFKFYDLNANGIYDEGDFPIQGWKIRATGECGFVEDKFTNADGKVFFELHFGDYKIEELMPLSKSWMATTPTFVEITVGKEPVDCVEFGNVCLGAGGGNTLGFWSNKNGQAMVGTEDLAMLRDLNLVKTDGTAFDPNDYKTLRTWLLDANATNMARMLATQLAAMKLNVFNNLVKSDALVYAPGTTSANAAGFATIAALMNEANAELGLHPLTIESNSIRNYQEALKNALDKANNNMTFVQSKACPVQY